jgi:hypothetical protein
MINGEAFTGVPAGCSSGQSEYFGLEHTAGSAAPGQRADVVFLDANPLSDITNSQSIRPAVVWPSFRQERAR